MKIHTTFETHAIICSLMQCGTDNTRRFQSNQMWHTQTVAALVVLGASRKWQSPSCHQTSMDWLYWWYNHMAHAVTPSTALAFVTTMSDKYKYTSQSGSKW